MKQFKSAGQLPALPVSSRSESTELPGAKASTSGRKSAAWVSVGMTSCCAAPLPKIRLSHIDKLTAPPERSPGICHRAEAEGGMNERAKGSGRRSGSHRSDNTYELARDGIDWRITHKMLHRAMDSRAIAVGGLDAGLCRDPWLIVGSARRCSTISGRTRYLTMTLPTVAGQVRTSGFLLSILSFGGAITGNIVAGIPLVASWRGTLLIAIGLVLTLRR